MRKNLRFILPPLVVLLGAVVAVVLVRSREAAETRSFQTPPPLVRVVPVTFTDYRFTVRSQGTVVPRTDIVLVSEVSGRVTAVSPSLAAGGFFEKGDVLITIESLDYRAAVERAKTSLKQAQLRLAQEEAQAKVAAREWNRVGEGEPTPLTLRGPQVAEARAAVAATGTALQLAERDLQRTRVRAPFAGRVRSKNVDVGQFVTRGFVLGGIYAVDYVEVRLPIPDSDAAFVDLPLSYRGEAGSDPGPEVRLSANFAGRAHTWAGRIVRTEGEIDPRTRMIYAVARVEDPFGRGRQPDRPPLSVGLFVSADILGHQVKHVVLLPRSAVRGRNRVLVVDDEDRLHLRDVQILRAEGEDVIVGAGLAEGDRVCLTPMDAVVDGMKVRTIPPDGSSPESDAAETAP